MNAGAYGGDFAQVLERALVVTATARLADAGRARPPYRHSELRHGQVVAQVELRLVPRPVEEIKATVAELQAQRKAAQPTNKRTFGSVFKNPDHELTAGRMLEACGLRGFGIGGAQISPMHANFIENAGERSTADAVALMAEARRRASSEFGVELEHEVEFLGPPELPPPTVGALSARGEVRRMSRERHVGRAAREAVARLPSCPRRRRARCPPAARSPWASLLVVAAALAVRWARARRGPSRSGRSTSMARRPRSAACRAALEPLEGTSLVGLAADEVAATCDGAARRRSSVTLRPRVPEHAARRVEPEQPLAVLRRGVESWLVSGGAA